MGGTGNIFDGIDFDSLGDQGPNGCVTAETYALDEDIGFAQAKGFGGFNGLFGRHLGGVGSAFFRAPEAGAAGAGTGDNIAFLIRHGNDGIIESRQNMNMAVAKAAAIFLLFDWFSLFGLCLLRTSGYYFVFNWLG